MRKFIFFLTITITTCCVKSQNRICLPEMVDLRGIQAIGDKGIYYVRDANIFIHGLDGSLKKSVKMSDIEGKPATQPMWIWAEKDLYTYEASPNRLMIFSPDGELLNQIDLGETTLKRHEIRDLTICGGNFFLSFAGEKATIACLTQEGRYINEFSTPPNTGDKYSLLASDEQGGIYQLFIEKNMILRKFDRTGRMQYEKNYGEGYGKMPGTEKFDRVEYALRLVCTRQGLVACCAQTIDGKRQYAAVTFDRNTGEIIHKRPIGGTFDFLRDLSGNKFYLVPPDKKGNAYCLVEFR